MLVDSHCHLDFPELNCDLEGVLYRAKSSGVGILQTICTKISQFNNILKISNAYPNIFCSVGNHPLNIKEEGYISPEEIASLCKKNRKVIGIGETGLDYYYSKENIEEQKRSFSSHIEASQEIGIPIIVHTRDAEKDTVKLLQNHMSKKPFTGVIHCFTASQWLADACVEMGLYISASGIVTFKNAESIREVFKNLPIDRILIETDSPFLAPVPKRGKTNEPSYVKYIAEFLATLKEEEFSVIEKCTTNNFFNLFQRAKDV